MAAVELKRGDRVTLHNSGIPVTFLGFGLTRFGAVHAVVETEDPNYRKGPFLHTGFKDGVVVETKMDQLPEVTDKEGNVLPWKIVLVVREDEIAR